MATTGYGGVTTLRDSFSDIVLLDINLGGGLAYYPIMI